MRLSLSLLGFLLVAGPALAQSQDPPKVGLSVTFFDVGIYPGFVQGFDGPLPLTLRQVPIHGDDSGAGRLITIRDVSPLKIDNRLGLGSIGVGPRFRHRAFALKANVLFTYAIAPSAGGEKITFEQNYQGSGRVQGAALVYYALVAETGWKRPGFDLQFRHRVEGRPNLITGYKLIPLRFNLEQGWDRYNKFESSEAHVLSNSKIHTGYMGVAFGPLTITVGRAHHQAGLTELGKSLNLKTKQSSWNFSFGTTAGF